MNKPSTRLREIGVEIGLFFLNQKNGDYNKTREFLRDLDIQDIKEGDETIFIYTFRPGLLIGHKGQNINGLVELFGKQIHIIETFSWTDIITPVDWMTELAMKEEDN